MPHIDLRARTEQDAVRVDEVDVVAAFHRAVDLRHACAFDDVQVVIGLRSLIELHGLAFGNGKAGPVDHVIRLFAGDVHLRGRCSNLCGI